MLLTILQCTEGPPQKRIIWPKMSARPQLRSPVYSWVLPLFSSSGDEASEVQGLAQDPRGAQPRPELEPQAGASLALEVETPGSHCHLGAAGRCRVPESLTCIPAPLEQLPPSPASAQRV